MELLELVPRRGLDRGAAEVEVVPLHVLYRLDSLVVDRIVELERDHVRLARLAPEVDTRQCNAPVAAVEGLGLGLGLGLGSGVGVGVG